MPEPKRTRRPAAAPPPPRTTHVVAIGVDDYDESSGFAPLHTGTSGASAFHACFLDVWQLGATAERLRLLTSKTVPSPSRGEMLKALHRLASEAQAGDRLVLFFSGHGHRMADEPGEIYLVPQDAYSRRAADALVSFTQIERALRDSPARERLVILDLSEALPPERYARAKDVTVLAAAGEAPRSSNPELTAFTHQLTRALRGASPTALDRQQLTVAGLAADLVEAQIPVLLHPGKGELLLADFSASALSPAGGGGARGLTFEATKPAALKTWLPDPGAFRYSDKILEARVNAALGEQEAPALGRLSAQLRRAFHWASSALGVEGSTLAFPGGAYSLLYRAKDQKNGHLVRGVKLARAWFGRGDEMAKLLTLLALDPDEMAIDLQERLAPERALAGLEAKGWEIESQLTDRIEARHADYTLVVEPMRLRLVGFPRLRGLDDQARLALLIAALEALRTGLG